MNKTLKSILMFGIPSLIIVILIYITVSIIKGKGGGSHCPSGLQQYGGVECLQCDPTDVSCAVCTKNTDCNGGTCYMKESPKNSDGTQLGVCQCVGGLTGLNCQTFCTGDGDCHGGTCTDGQCKCPAGMGPPNCKEPFDLKKCISSPNCNSILINQLKCTKTNDIDSTIQILYYADKQFNIGDKINLSGFPPGGTPVWTHLNSPKGFVGYDVIGGSNCQSPGCENDGYQCWYTCNDGSNDPKCQPDNGPFYPPVGHNIGDVPVQDRCNPGSFPDSTCFTHDCPVYNTVLISIPTFILVKTAVGEEVYNYVNWDTSAVISFNDGTATCYNNSKMSESVSDDIYCLKCEPGWGPGVDGIQTFTNKSGRTNAPPLGFCGRRKNSYRIRMALNDEHDGTNSDCRNTFGVDSCRAADECQNDNDSNCPNGPGVRTTCTVDKFWAIPGTNCQNGAWNGCTQCDSCEGKHDEDHFWSTEKCGAIPDYTLDPKTIVCNDNNGQHENNDFGDSCNTPSNLLDALIPTE